MISEKTLKEILTTAEYNDVMDGAIPLNVVDAVLRVADALSRIATVQETMLQRADAAAGRLEAHTRALSDMIEGEINARMPRQ